MNRRKGFNNKNELDIKGCRKKKYESSEKNK